MKIAIIGGGIAGLTAAHYLNPDHEIQLFEAAPEVGGHTYTVSVEEGDTSLPASLSVSLSVDMGFIVHNDRTYPHFVRLMEDLGVVREDSDMSFSVRCEQSGLEYNGTSLNALFAQRRNLLSPHFYRMIRGMLRFHRAAGRLLDESAGEEDLALGRFLERERIPRLAVERYVVPMAAAIWSTGEGKVLDYPARSLATFLHNHGMLTVSDRPQWKVIRGGSRSYVDALTAPFRDRIATATPVEQVRRPAPRPSSRQSGGVEIKIADGEATRFDQVVFATHSDQALRLLAAPTPAEREVLAAIPYQDNEVVLHTDTSLLPRRRRAWAAWNYHLNPRGLSGESGADREGRVQVTYWMNRLQNLTARGARRDYCVTLNRPDAIDPAKVLHRVCFAHPLYTPAGLAAQRRWGEISGADRIHYCGAYWGYGFHEDGVVSARRVVAALGAAAADRASEAGSRAA